MVSFPKFLGSTSNKQITPENRIWTRGLDVHVADTELPAGPNPVDQARGNLQVTKAHYLS
jgi:hypothetical protein